MTTVIKMYKFNVIWVIVLLQPGLVTAWASDFVLEGRVTEISEEPEAQPLKNVDIYLYSGAPPKRCPDSEDSDEIYKKTVSKKDGGYRFTDLEAEEYSVHFCRDGYSLHPLRKKRDPSKSKEPLVVSLSRNDARVTAAIGFSFAGFDKLGWTGQFAGGIESSIRSRHPGVDVQSLSGYGEFSSGAAQVLVSDRYLTVEELGLKRDGAKNLTVSVIAAAPVRVVVNEKNPVSGLTYHQVSDILCADSNSGMPAWNQLGMPDWNQNVNVYSEELAIGQVWTNWWGLSIAPHQSGCRGRTAQPGDLTMVAGDPYGVGFTGRWTQTAKTKAVTLGWNPAGLRPPNRESLFNGMYPLTTNVYVYSLGGRDGIAGFVSEEIRAFTYELAGRDALTKGGFLLPPEPLQIPAYR